MAAHGKRNHQYFQCDHCGDESSFDLHEGTCSAEGCEKELCVGCIHDCKDCDGAFCPEHIVAIPVSALLHTAEHVCLTCHSKRRQLQAA